MASRRWLGSWTMTARYDRSSARSRSAFVLMTFAWIECATSRAMAELGPCTTAAPTTPEVVMFVSDLNRSMRWYHEKVGLEASSLNTVERADSRAVKMTRNGVGVTLVSSGRPTDLPRDPQMVCFVLEGPPAPSLGSSPLFLVDPDGTSVEFPAFSSPPGR